MKEVSGDIWDFHAKGHWIVATTNGSLRKDGCAVMGRGIAKEARQRFPGLSRDLGWIIRVDGGNHLVCVDGGLILFPTKHKWFEKADLALIEKSCQELKDLFDNWAGNCLFPIYLVRPGCGNGGLDWEDVRPVLKRYLDDRFTVVEKNSNSSGGKIEGDKECAEHGEAGRDPDAGLEVRPEIREQLLQSAQLPKSKLLTAEDILGAK